MAGSPDVLSGTFAGRYTIERELGSGATATVFLARDTQRGIAVAVKLLRHELAQSVGADRFLREIRLNEKLHHPHIVPVLDSGESDGRLYFVLPHMEEGSLRQLLQREKQLPIETAIGITKTIAQALDYAHQHNLIHRDVKPENILFTSGQACLADFGIARAVERALDESTTDTGMVRGTPAYMSPEQASGSRQYDGRSDQYSLACVLYEMLAGVPAFIGPTPEAVIAQRFQHAPRELRVYRPSVSEDVERVITKALSLSPADRFVTIGEFADALDTASRTPTSRNLHGRSPRRQTALVVALGIATAAIGWGAYTEILDGRSSPAVALDTTRLVVLPVAGADSTQLPYDLLLHEAASRWRGISVVDRFQVADALEQHGAQRENAAGDRLARSLGAGRYIRGEARPSGDSIRLSVALMDVPSGSALHSVSASVPRHIAAPESTYANIVEQLLVRAGAAPNRDVTQPSRSLPARQAFARAMTALNDWDLVEADSLLETALAFDAEEARAQFWLAQIRAWNIRPPRDWLALVQRSMLDEARLTQRERQLASALALLGARDFKGACRIYEALRQSNPKDFAAWFGLGRCLNDDVVVADPRSPTGWRFRSSYAAASSAYVEALRLLPTSYKSLQRSAFEPLRAILYTDEDRLRGGVGLPPDSTRFLARLVQLGDTIAFLPVPFGQPLDAAIDRSAFIRGLQAQRQLFRDIAHAWSTSLPTSAGAKEAVAVSLELLGDPSAVDSIRVARRLARSRAHALRLASTEVSMTAKFAIPDDTGALRNAGRLADSILATANPSDEEAAYLAPVAALFGRCEQAIALTRRASTLSEALVPLPRFVVADVHGLETGSILGCPGSSVSQIYPKLRSRIPASGATQREAELLITRRLARNSFPLDSQLVHRMAHPGDPLLTAEKAALDGNREQAVQILRTIQQRRWPRRNGGSADSFVAEARLWLMLGDTAAAREHLDSGFVMLPRQPPISFDAVGLSVVRAASLHRGALVRAQLANAGVPSDSRWSAVTRILRSQ